MRVAIKFLISAALFLALSGCTIDQAYTTHCPRCGSAINIKTSVEGTIYGLDNFNMQYYCNNCKNISTFSVKTTRVEQAESVILEN